MVDLLNTSSLPNKGNTRILYRFSGFEFDASTLEIRSGDGSVRLEGTVRGVLLILLESNGQAVSREEFFDQVWGNRIVEDSNLTVAISRLRSALGDRDRSLVKTIPRVGYRFAGTIERELLHAPALAGLDLEPGEEVAGRPTWKLVRQLGEGGFGQVWLATHPETGASRVFKFAADSRGLRALKRERAVYAIFQRSGIGTDGLIPIVDENFEEVPYFIGMEFGGTSLDAKFGNTDEYQRQPLEKRLNLLHAVANTISRAHELGIYHQDVKPSNILLDDDLDAPRLMDFGNSLILDIDRLISRSITQHRAADATSTGGTLMYIAPEVIEGHAPTTRSDIYSLGVLLYQACIGNLRKPLAPGWESEISDPVLAADIRDAVQGNPDHRMASAAELAHRLATLDARREAHAAEAARHLRERELKRELDRSRARRPWVVAATILLAAGVSTTGFLYLDALRANQLARHNLDVANALNAFLRDDLYAAADPRRGGHTDVTLLDAARVASNSIGTRLAASPDVVFEVTLASGDLLFQLDEFSGASRVYTDAVNRAAVTTKPQDASYRASIRAALAATMDGQFEVAESLRQSLEDEFGSNLTQSRRIQLDFLAVQQLFMQTRWKELLPRIDDLLPRLEGNHELVNIQLFNASHAIAGFTYLALSDLERARWHQETWGESIRSRGEESGYYAAVSAFQAAKLAKKSGNYAAAVESANLAYERFMKFVGPHHTDTNSALQERAIARVELGEIDAAVEDLEGVITALDAMHGAEHLYTLMAISDLGAILNRHDRTDLAIQKLKPALATAQGALGEDHFASILLGYNLTSAYIRADRLEEADKQLRATKAVGDGKFPAGNQWFGRIALLQAKLALAKGELESAQDLLTAAIPMLQAALDPKSSAVVEAREILADLELEISTESPTN